jgi:hypothetical protein
MIRPASADPRKWTILAYISGDNNLEAPMVNSLLQMERVGTSDSVSLLAQLDRRSFPEKPSIPPEFQDDPDIVAEITENWKKKMEKLHLRVDGDWSTARRYVVEKGVDNPSEIECHEGPQGDGTCEIHFKTDKIASPVIKDLGETDMGDPANLKDFLQWGMQQFPAEHYMLIFMDHGLAYMGCMTDEAPANVLALPDMVHAIKEVEDATGKKLDIIGFNACLMGSAEVAYQLRNCADIMVASQEVENAPGWPIAEIMRRVAEAPADHALSPTEVAQCIVAESEKNPLAMPTLSALDLKKIDAVKSATEELSRNLIDPALSSYQIRKSIRESLHFGQMAAPPEGDHVDIIDMCGHISLNEKIARPSVNAACEELSHKVKEALIAGEHAGKGMEEAHGLSLYAPANRMTYDPFSCKNPITNAYDEKSSFSYRKLDFSQDSKWEELLRTKLTKF